MLKASHCWKFFVFSKATFFFKSWHHFVCFLLLTKLYFFHLYFFTASSFELTFLLLFLWPILASVWLLCLLWPFWLPWRPIVKNGLSPSHICRSIVFILLIFLIDHTILRLFCTSLNSEGVGLSKLSSLPLHCRVPISLRASFVYLRDSPSTLLLPLQWMRVRHVLRLGSTLISWVWSIKTRVVQRNIWVLAEMS